MALTINSKGKLYASLTYNKACEDMPFSDRLLHTRRAKRMSQAALAAEVGVTPQAISQWENNVTSPDYERVKRVAGALGVDPLWLYEGLTIAKSEKSADGVRESWKVPVIDHVQAGVWTEIMASQELPECAMFLDVYEKPRGHAFALLVMGQSMEPEFKEGDVVVIDTGVAPLPGDYVIAKLEGSESATFKKYRPRQFEGLAVTSFDLVPLNADWPTLTVSPEHPGEVVGVMVEHRRYRRR